MVTGDEFAYLPAFENVAVHISRFRPPPLALKIQNANVSNSERADHGRRRGPPLIWTRRRDWHVNAIHGLSVFSLATQDRYVGNALDHVYETLDYAGSDAENFSYFGGSISLPSCNDSLGNFGLSDMLFRRCSSVNRHFAREANRHREWEAERMAALDFSVGPTLTHASPSKTA